MSERALVKTRIRATIKHYLFFFARRSAPKSRPSWQKTSLNSRDRSNEIYNNHKSQYTEMQQYVGMDGVNNENYNSINSINSNVEKFTVPVHERLYATRHNKVEATIAGKEEQFLKEMKDCTFSPQLVKNKYNNGMVDSMENQNNSVQNPGERAKRASLDEDEKLAMNPAKWLQTKWLHPLLS